jgi:UDP-glucose 4-epimerase
MKIVVAGGAGLIGSRTVRTLVNSGHEVIVIDNFLTGMKENLADVIDRITLLECDICQKSSYEDAVGSFDALYHLAFPTPLCTRDLAHQFYEIASLGTANLLELCFDRDAYFLYGSSVAVYGLQRCLPIDEDHPTVPMLIYGANKLHGEQLCASFHQTFGLRYSMLRIANTYGPNDKRRDAIQIFIDNCRAGQPMRIRGGGQQRRCFTLAQDVAVASVMALEAQPECETLNVATNETATVIELAETVRAIGWPDAEIIFEDGGDDPRDYVFSNDRFSKQIGLMKYTPLPEGLRVTIEDTYGKESLSRSGLQNSLEGV